MRAEDCREALERIRWPDGPVCPHCSASGHVVSEIGGTSHRPGLYLCSECRKQFTVTVGTPLEGSKLPLSAWLQAAHMLNTLPKAVTVREVEQTLGVTYKTAWHMVRKLLEAVENYRGPLPLFGKTVQAHVEPFLPKTRNTKAGWVRRERQKAAGTYKAPRVPVAAGALSGLQFDPPATKSHAERTERFLRWILEH
ncbi:transposase [Bradyrhizobium tunisiense]|uniref:transposase n=1 Tax=Bradyrhizobium tunisiense TaxID=3278709 RepID=UPI0035DDCF9D